MKTTAKKTAPAPGRGKTNATLTAMEPTFQPDIHTIRGVPVMLDSDLARAYGVSTSQLNRAVKRKPKKFPEMFAFQLTNQELENLICQIGISSSHGGIRKLPLVFTEYGAIAAANVLNSPKAVEMSIVVVKAFVEGRRAARSLPSGVEDARMAELTVMYLDLRLEFNGKLQEIDGQIARMEENHLRDIQNLKAMVVRKQDTPRLALDQPEGTPASLLAALAAMDAKQRELALQMLEENYHRMRAIFP
jgi:hypothetical protein